MKILHTADWHLGKNLDGYSRIGEQKLFLKDFVELSRAKKPSIILISGDIYDNPNPPAIAQTMFYETIKKASNEGRTMIIVIPGNHDSAMRLSSAKNLARMSGIILMENYDDIVPLGQYGKNRVVQSDEGVIKVDIGGQEAVIIMLPFISESSLGKNFMDIDNSEEENSSSYQKELEMLINKRKEVYQEDTVNLMMAHLFTVKSQLSGDERSSQLGSAYMMDSSIFPKEADYIALGHIHKFQAVSGTNRRAYYSGSPIHYNKTESKTQSKYIIEVDVDEKKNIKVNPIPIPVYKKIDIWQVKNLQEAITMSQEKSHENSWVYIEIEDSAMLTPDDIGLLKKNKKDIIDIRTGRVKRDSDQLEDMSEKTESEKFSLFYQEIAGEDVPDQVLDKFIYFLNKVEEDEFQ